MWSCSTDHLKLLGPHVHQMWTGRAGLRSPHQELSLVSCLYHPSWFPFLALDWGQPFSLPSSETLNNSLPSFILLLWSVTLSCSSRAFSFSRLYKFSSSLLLSQRALQSSCCFINFSSFLTHVHRYTHFFRGELDWRKYEKAKIMLRGGGE